MAHHRRLSALILISPLLISLLAATVFISAEPTTRQSSFRWSDVHGTKQAPDDAPPLQLTASDGTGLELIALTARGVLEPPLAFTELHMSFENPQNRVREGRFRITLPPGAAISRFAMKIGDHWQEGEVVERQRARRIYEDFLHRRQDPALLEHEAGNEFSARVFPIPARAVKELIVSYSHELPGSDDVYTIPLRGLPRIDRLDIQVQLEESSTPARGVQQSNLGGEVRERRVISLSKKGWTPNDDFEIRQSEVATRQGLRHGDLAVVRVPAPVADTAQEIDSLYVLIDTSASRALGFEQQIDLLRRLLSGLRDGAGPQTPIAIAAFDQSVERLFEGSVGELEKADIWDSLRARGALGASDPHRAVRWLVGKLAEKRMRPDYRRVLVISDGVATAGEVEGQALRDAVSDLAEVGIERLDVLATGGRRDDDLLRLLVTGNLEFDGQVIAARAGLDEIARRLTRASTSGIAVTVPGANWVWPQTLDAVQPGDEVLIYADLPSSQPLRLKLGDTPVPVEPATIFEAEPKLLERAWTKARIDRLLRLRETDFAEDKDLRRAMQREATELSVAHRVLTPFTAFLVLETEHEYSRYGLDRRARADILTVGAAGLEVLARTAAPPLPRQTGSRKAEVAGEMARDAAVARENPAAPPTDQTAELQSLGYVEGNAHIAAENEQIAALEDEAQRLEAELAALDFGEVEPRDRRLEEPEPLRGDESDSVTEEIAIAPPPPRPRRVPIPDPTPDEDEAPDQQQKNIPALAGRLADVMKWLEAGQVDRAFAAATEWHAESPGDTLALIALGETLAARGDLSQAARAYGSLIDLFPSRADLRRHAGERLESLADRGALELAVDTYRKARDQRPDHPSSHRLLAYALLRSEQLEEAFSTLVAGLEQRYPGDRFRGVARIMREDLGLVAAAWARAQPEQAAEIRRRMRHAGGTFASEPSLRFVLSWETDANDVDLHIYDGKKNHAYYSHKQLPTGGELYADVTTGYGPECFTIGGASDRHAYPYRLQAHYYSRGPMGYGMGLLRIVDHDGKGGLRFEQRPFVVMNDQAYVDLGTVGKR